MKTDTSALNLSPDIDPDDRETIPPASKSDDTSDESLFARPLRSFEDKPQPSKEEKTKIRLLKGVSLKTFRRWAVANLTAEQALELSLADED